MKENKSYSKSGSSEKKMWMRIAVVAVCAVMFLGFIILPLI